MQGTTHTHTYTEREKERESFWLSYFTKNKCQISFKYFIFLVLYKANLPHHCPTPHGFTSKTHLLQFSPCFLNSSCKNPLPQTKTQLTNLLCIITILLSDICLATILSPPLISLLKHCLLERSALISSSNMVSHKHHQSSLYLALLTLLLQHTFF